MRLSFVSVVGLVTSINAIALNPNDEVDKRAGLSKPPCDKVESIACKFHGTASLSRACTSLLGPARTSAVTITKTQAQTITRGPPATTKTITTRLSTATTETSYNVIDISTTRTIPVTTTTIYSFIIDWTTLTSRYGNAVPRGLEDRATYGGGSISGVAKTAVLTACSCLLPQPTKTTIVTNTRTVSSTRRNTVTKTATSLVYTVTKTVTTKTTNTLSYVTFATTVSEVITSHAPLTVTTCAGTNPTPSFKMQFVDNGARTDRFDRQYVTPVKDTWTGADNYAVEATKLLASANLWNIDCVNRLVTRLPGLDGNSAVRDFYPCSEFFFPTFQPIIIMDQKRCVRSDFDILNATAEANGFLHTYIDATGIGFLDVLETVPSYRDMWDEWGTYPFLVIGDGASPEPPEHNRFRFKKA